MSIKEQSEKIEFLQCYECMTIRTWHTDTTVSHKMSHPDYCPTCNKYYYEKGLKRIIPPFNCVIIPIFTDKGDIPK